MELVLTCLKIAKSFLGLLKLLGGLGKSPLGTLLQRIAMASAEVWKSIKKATTPKWRAFSRKPTVGRLLDRYTETVLLYLIALGILMPGPFYALLFRLHIEMRPTVGLLFLGFCMLSMVLGTRYWKIASYSKEALNHEWTFFRRTAGAAAYAKLWTLTLMLPAIAFLFEVAPSLLADLG